MTEQTREPSQLETANSIADQLQEHDEAVRRQIQTIVYALGRTQARALLQETLNIEDQGGLMLPDQSRRRTPGGVFFHLVYTTGKPKEGRSLKRPQFKKPAKRPDSPPAQKTERADQPVIPFNWEDRITAINTIGTEKGTATTVKITLIGKLGKHEDRGTCIVGVMQSGEKMPALPKGVPAPAPTKTNYVVYVGAKQWKGVAATADDPEDAFIIEGYPQIDTKTNAISVFATNITSKKLQAAKRQAQN